VDSRKARDRLYASLQPFISTNKNRRKGNPPKHTYRLWCRTSKITPHNKWKMRIQLGLVCLKGAKVLTVFDLKKRWKSCWSLPRPSGPCCVEMVALLVLGGVNKVLFFSCLPPNPPPFDIGLFLRRLISNFSSAKKFSNWDLSRYLYSLTVWSTSNARSWLESPDLSPHFKDMYICGVCNRTYHWQCLL